MPDFENANAHDSGDCTVDCQHPDHEYEGSEIDLDVLLEMRQLAFDSGQPEMFDKVLGYYGLTEEDLDLPDHEGPVEL